MLTDGCFGLAVQFCEHGLCKPKGVSFEPAFHFGTTVLALKEDEFASGWCVVGGVHLSDGGVVVSSDLVINLYPTFAC